MVFRNLPNLIFENDKFSLQVTIFQGYSPGTAFENI